MAERLNFGRGQMQYNSMLAAEHLCRYYSLKSSCKGKTVLDVACGDGYGSKLLADWGAKRVVAIDVSDEAIQRAREMFPNPNVEYNVGDVCLPNVAGIGNRKFDIICSFETIEHLEDPIPFLKNILKWRRKGGVVVISAPNDEVVAADATNPFHKTRYSFDSLKKQTESIFGVATDWLMGNPVQGFALLPQTGLVASRKDADINTALQAREGAELNWIAPEQWCSIEPKSSAFWIGIWGSIESENLVASPMSMIGHLDMWNSLVYVKKELLEKTQLVERITKAAHDHENTLALLQEEVSRLQSDLRHKELNLAEDRRANLNDKQKISELQSEIRRRDMSLAEERRINLSDKLRILDLSNLVEHGVRLSETARHDVAREVMFERQRWSLIYKITCFAKRLLRI
jgi:2-polyprenyl-3-methyl-5-hydroxy-6-metoxy-1,4-benzoquinol methylase